jgi:hypothetical protein
MEPGANETATGAEVLASVIAPVFASSANVLIAVRPLADEAGAGGAEKANLPSALREIE